MEKEKKPFKETKFGQFLSKAGNVIKDNGGDVIDIAFTAATQGPVAGINKAINALKSDSSPEAKQLLNELELRRMEFESEMYALEVEDRKSARTRQVDLAKAGGNDWLMGVVGLVILSLLVLTVVTIFFLEIKNAEMAHFIAGEIMGLGTALAVYYFGSSKGSKDKQKAIDQLTGR